MLVMPRLRNPAIYLLHPCSLEFALLVYKLLLISIHQLLINHLYFHKLNFLIKQYQLNVERKSRVKLYKAKPTLKYQSKPKLSNETIKT